MKIEKLLPVRIDHLTVRTPNNDEITDKINQLVDTINRDNQLEAEGVKKIFAAIEKAEQELTKDGNDKYWIDGFEDHPQWDSKLFWEDTKKYVLDTINKSEESQECR